MEYCAAERKKESLPFATVWLEREIIIQREIIQLVKDKYHDFSYKRNLINKIN